MTLSHHLSLGFRGPSLVSENSERGMLGPASTLLVTSTMAVRIDVEANDWSETAQTSKLDGI
jgi:hypothetical protein